MKRVTQMLCLTALVGWFDVAEAGEDPNQPRFFWRSKELGLSELRLGANHLQEIPVGSTYQLQRLSWETERHDLFQTEGFELHRIARLSMDRPCSYCQHAVPRHASLGAALVPLGSPPADPGQSGLPFKPPRSRLAWRKPLGWSATGVGGAALVSGLICHLYAFSLSNETPTTTSEQEKLNNRIDNLTVAYIVLYSTGAAVALTGIALLLWEEYAPFTPQVAVSPEHASLSIAGVF